MWGRGRLDVTRRRHGASFMSSGGYHHHVAVNTWHSAGAGVRRGTRTGLDWFTVEVNDQATLDDVKRRLDAAGVSVETMPGGFAAADPWGTKVRFTIVG